MTTRRQLESRLQAFKVRLVARQALRSAYTGLAGAAAGLGLGVVFLELLPRLLFGAGLGVVALIAAAIAGCLVAVAWELRRYHVPSLHETALALESRLPADTGALGAALRVDETDPFFGPVLARAEFDLKAAEHAPAPVLIRTRRLVLVPLLALASGVAFAAVIGAEPPVTGKAKTATVNGDARTWSSVDVGGGRTEADRAAYREALGMKETAATLNRSAATLRDANATAADTHEALEKAKGALEGADGKLTGMTAEAVPDAAPATEAEREALAAKLEAAARGLQSAAAKVEHGKSGSIDIGKDGDFGADSTPRDLVPFPRVEPLAATPVHAIAAQTPARRELAARAVKALEKLQK